jgi:hypothetical protein
MQEDATMSIWRVLLITALSVALFWRIRCFIESIMR